MASSRESGLSHYSPISTLERQYTGAGQCVCLFVKTNANCCLSGGVEGILKLRKSGGAAGSLLAKEQQDLGGSSVASTNSDGSSSAATDPFSFLNTSDDEEDETDNDLSADGAAKKGNKFGRFFKKVATKTSKSLERGMHGLAIRADQGRNSDLLSVGLYDDKDILITMTESVPLPQDDQNRLQGTRFVIPLVLLPDQDNSRQVSVKLWIRSGAALLQQTNAAKNYLIGSVHLSAGQIRQSLQAASSSGSGTSSTKPAAFFHATLQSALVADGQLTFCATPDPKFPAVCTRGWSLTDPDTAGYTALTSGGVGTTSGGTGLYNPPLDQPYGFAVPNKNSACMVAVERSIESTVVLPIAAAFGALSAAACKSSLTRCQTITGQVLANRHDVAVGEYCDCNVGIGFLKMSDPSSLNGATATSTPIVTASWQRPDSIFEMELLRPTKMALQPLMGDEGGFQPTSSFRFFPKPCRKDVLPGVLQAAGGQMPPSGFLGNIRLAIAIPKPKANGVQIENPFGMVSGASHGHGAQEEDWECIIALESLAQRSPNSNPVFEFPVRNTTGQIVGSAILSLTIQMQQGPAVPSNIPPAQEGLVSLTGLLPLTDCVLPELDFDTLQSHTDPTLQRRHQQMATMGHFVTHAYMEQHVNSIRVPDTKLLQEKATKYRAALATSSTEGKLPAHLDRSPKPFRPSASRTEVLLSGIGFNVHIASLEVKVLDPDAINVPTGALFHNITCGAPADHARGFGDVFATKKDPTVARVGFNSPVGSAAGGLRRLEAKREELAKEVSNLQTSLTMGVANYFVAARQGNKPVNHVPSRHAELAGLRWKVFEAVQALNHLTWVCAIRRASTFSQALGIAVSSYLTSLSDAAKLESKWPDFWARHGYLVTYEGMLSAAGKELGMIEDASVAISMLRMVKLVLVPDDGAMSVSRVPVPSSPYLRWVDLSVSKVGPETSYTLRIGVVPTYFDQRVPAVLKNGIPVTLYPVLFEVGVDIRQWGSYAGSNMKSQLAGTSGSEQRVGGLLDDEDDDEGVADDDVLVQLNYEAFRKMNVYAFAVSPSNTPKSPQKTHPMLETLYQHIVSSSGKMNHDILDEAAGLAHQLGGGGVVFCKSGKDRTAMHVTYKKAQFANRYRQHYHSVDGLPTVDSTLTDAMIMRLYGTRLPICEKNVGQAKYAFNSLQVKFMPDALKPPMSALAGFLKGGKVFSSGGIES